MAQPNTNIPSKKGPRPARNPNGNVWFWVIMGRLFILFLWLPRTSQI